MEVDDPFADEEELEETKTMRVVFPKSGEQRTLYVGNILAKVRKPRPYFCNPNPVSQLLIQSN